MQQQLIAILYARMHQRIDQYPLEAMRWYLSRHGPTVTLNPDGTLTYTWT